MGEYCISPMKRVFFQYEPPPILYRSRESIDTQSLNAAVLIVVGSREEGNFGDMTAGLSTVDYLKQCGVKDENIFLICDTSELNTTPGLFRPFGKKLKLHINSEIDYQRVLKNFKGNHIHDFVGAVDVIQSFTQAVECSVDIVILFYWNHGSPDSLGMPNGKIKINDFGALFRSVLQHSEKHFLFFFDACSSTELLGNAVKEWERTTKKIAQSDLKNLVIVTSSDALNSSWNTKFISINGKWFQPGSQFFRQFSRWINYSFDKNKLISEVEKTVNLTAGGFKMTVVLGDSRIERFFRPKQLGDLPKNPELLPEDRKSGVLINEKDAVTKEGKKILISSVDYEMWEQQRNARNLS